MNSALSKYLNLARKYLLSNQMENKNYHAVGTKKSKIKYKNRRNGH